MSLTSETIKTVFTCSGGLTYDFTFKVFDEDDLEVILYTTATGVETTLTKTTHYAVSALSSTGGRITTVAAYTSAYQIIVRRKQPFKQEADWERNGDFSTDVLEKQLDKNVMMLQTLKEQVDRAVFQDATTTIPITLPGASEGKVLGWVGGVITNVPPGEKGDKGDTGATGPAGAGSGDVLGPATNTDLKVPQWDGANTKTLKDGLAVGTGASQLVQLTAAAKLPAVDGSLLTDIPAHSADKITSGTLAATRGGTGQTMFKCGRSGSIASGDNTITFGGTNFANTSYYLIVTESRADGGSVKGTIKSQAVDGFVWTAAGGTQDYINYIAVGTSA